MTSLKPYLAYRPTDLPWLGQIPPHWETKRLKFAAIINPSKTEISHLPKNLEVSFLPMELVCEGTFIKELNERFGTEFAEEDRLVIHQIEQKLAQDERLEQTIRVNTPENAMLTFKQVLQDMFHEMLETNFKFYQHMDGNPDFASRLTQIMFDRYRNTLMANSA
jgi:hypothetical protein